MADVSGELLGLTAIGRATITALSMNRVLAVAIRTRSGHAIDGRDGLFAARGSEPTVCRASTFHCVRCRVAIVNEQVDASGSSPTVACSGSAIPARPRR